MLTTAHKASKPLVHRAQSLGNSVVETSSAVVTGLSSGLLRRYYDGLLAHGVQGSSWQQCWNDYRLSVILVSIFIPVWRWAVFRWTPDLAAVARSMTAFDDLGCAELLDTG